MGEAEGAGAEDVRRLTEVQCAGRVGVAGRKEVLGEQGEFDGDGDEGLVGFEADADGGEEAGEDAGGEAGWRGGGGGAAWPTAHGGGGGQHVGKDEDGGEVVALAEVAGWDDGEDRDEGEGEPGELVGRERRGGEAGRGCLGRGCLGWGCLGWCGQAAEEVEGESGAPGFGEEDEEFAESGGGEVEVVAEGDGDGGEPNDQGWVGVKGIRAIEDCAVEPAPGHEQKPELVVSGGG